MITDLQAQPFALYDQIGMSVAQLDLPKRSPAARASAVSRSLVVADSAAPGTATNSRSDRLGRLPPQD